MVALWIRNVSLNVKRVRQNRGCNEFALFEQVKNITQIAEHPKAKNWMIDRKINKITHGR